MNAFKPADSMDELLDSPTEHNPNQQAPKLKRFPEFLHPGTLVGDYRIISEVARGAGGIVYRAQQQSLGRDVALKFMLRSGNQDSVDRFQSEAQAAASLDHPGIVPVYEVGEHQGNGYFTMALVEGESLASRLGEGPLPARDAAAMTERIARAVAHAHQRNLIHRDLKPANILIDRDGKPRITDFGVCKHLHEASKLTADGQLIGTPHYMPPEQTGVANAEVGEASDVYSLGAVLYAMLTARPPFQAANPVEVVSQVLTKNPVSMRVLTPSIPAELDTIVMKCLSKATRSRYASATELADDLKRFLNGEPIHARPPGLLRRLIQSVRRHIFVASVSGSAAIILVTLTTVLIFSSMRMRMQLSDLQDQLGQERQTTAMYLNATRTSKRDNSPEEGRTKHKMLADFAVRRLADSAKRLKLQERNDTALQIAIEAAQLALQNELSIPARVEAILRDAAGQPEHVDFMQPESIEVSELISLAKSRVMNPLTEYERSLFGIPNTSPENAHDLGTPDAK